MTGPFAPAPPWIRRVAAWFGVLAAGGAWACLLAWAIGRTLGDRWLWSQLVSEIPPPLLIVGGGVGLALRRLLRGPARTPARAQWRRALLAFALLASVHLLLLDWRLYRALLQTPKAADGRSLRVLAWNPSWERMSAFGERVLETRPDVAVIATPHYTSDFATLRDRFGGPTWATRSPTFACVSGLPVVRWGWTSLNIRESPDRPAWLRPGMVSVRGGEAMFVELDATDRLGRRVVVWAVDLPSDPFLKRRNSLGDMMASIGAFRGPVYRREADGQDVPEVGTIRGFPAPDLIVGDFNTPRNSRSFGLLPAGMEDAYAQAGWGPSGTFPRRWPLLHIDHAFVGPGLRAVRYDAVNLDAGRHAAQVVEVVTPAK